MQGDSLKPRCVFPSLNPSLVKVAICLFDYSDVLWVVEIMLLSLNESKAGEAIGHPPMLVVYIGD